MDDDPLSSIIDLVMALGSQSNPEYATNLDIFSIRSAVEHGVAAVP
jgi:hypothetical protein